MKLNFVKVNPVENMTVFILDEIDRKEHIKISQKLMNYNNLYAEQIGFIEKSKKDNKLIRLQMMGNEFCGNATRSLAALSVYKGYENVVKKDGKYFVDVETSGLETVLRCEVRATEKENTYFSKIQMPLPKKLINQIEVGINGKKIELFRVDFDGITHFVVDSCKIDDKNVFFEHIQAIIEKEEYEAFGVMFFDFDKYYLEPLVYVKATDSLFWERSCASGASSVGAVLTYINSKNMNVDIRQLGGILQIETVYDGGDIKKILLDGTVEIVAEGIVIL